MIRKAFWKKTKIKSLIILTAIITLTSCGGGDYVPKPRAYPRIAFPEKSYQKFDTTFPYSFEYPVYSAIVADRHAISEPYWINIVFPRFNGQLHISYKKVEGNINELTEDTRKFVMKHIPKASNIIDNPYSDTANNVHGLIYNIQGAGAASAYQFYVTDSTNHFMRGALYFNMVPNNDSLQPVINFIKEDIKHMINTLNWKSNY